MTPETHHRCTWIMATTLTYAVLIFATSFGDGAAFMDKHFKPGPFGVPARVVACVIVSVAYVPFVWFFWHICRVVMVLHGHEVRGDNMGRSVFVSVGALVYFLALCGTWIVYAAIRGI